jgi:hypothetical protein
MLVDNNGLQTDQNFGARPDFEVGEVPNLPNLRRHELMRFDVSALSGKFAVIDGITLRLYPTIVTTNGSEAIQVFRVSTANQGWVEGTGSFAPFGDPPDTGQSTWQARVQGSQPWAGAEGASALPVDHDVLLGAAPFDTSTQVGAANPFDIVFDPALVNALVNGWLSGNNAGLFLKTVTENDRHITFSSAEALDVAVHPELIISYRTQIPEPTAGLLLAAITAPLLARRRR